MQKEIPAPSSEKRTILCMVIMLYNGVYRMEWLIWLRIVEKLHLIHPMGLVCPISPMGQMGPIRPMGPIAKSRHLRRLLFGRGHRAPMPNGQLSHRTNGPGNQGDDKSPAREIDMPVFQDIKRADAHDKKGPENIRGDQDVRQSGHARRIEHHLPKIENLRPRPNRRLDDVMASRSLLPGVRDNDPDRRKHRAQRHHQRGKEMHPGRNPIPERKQRFPRPPAPSRTHRQRTANTSPSSCRTETPSRSRSPRPARNSAQISWSRTAPSIHKPASPSSRTSPP